MKKMIMLFGIFALTLSGCSDSSSSDASGEAKAEETKEEASVAYTVDVANSSINWTDGNGEHSGVLSLSEGSVNMKGGNITEGTLTVDMNSVSVEIEGGGSEKLLAHLKTEDFFNVEKFPTATVSLGASNEGKVPTTITFLGVPMEKSVPVSVTVDDKGGSITGTFEFDFAPSMMPYITPDEKGEVGAPSNVKFNINIVLKK